ncbi:MAG: AraC family transcriptional regulator [Planctomycetota bacterium]
MAFHERAPGKQLSRHVQCIWIAAQSPGGEGRIVPDGCVEIVFAVDGAFCLAVEPGRVIRSSPVTVLGLATRPLGVAYHGRSRLVGVRLTPAGAMRLFARDTACLGNGAADGTALVPALARRLADAVATLVASGSQGALEHALQTALDAAPVVDPRVEQAASLLHLGSASTSIAAVAREVGLSTRQLDRCFERWFGISPKLFERIARFQRAFDLGMRARRGQWALIAAHCGYADQSHLCRDFLEFTQETPDRMRASLGVAIDV